MKQKLEMDDLRVGMYITILQGATTTGMNGDPCERREHRKHKGRVLEIIAIKFPYIAVNVYHFRGDSEKEVFDFREVEFMELSHEYVSQLCPDLEINNSFWEEVEGDSLKEADATIEEAFNNTNTK